MNTQFDCPHCHAVTVVPEDADFDGLCGSCQEDIFRYPAEDTHEEPTADAPSTMTHNILSTSLSHNGEGWEVRVNPGNKLAYFTDDQDTALDQFRSITESCSIQPQPDGEWWLATAGEKLLLLDDIEAAVEFIINDRVPLFTEDRPGDIDHSARGLCITTPYGLWEVTTEQALTLSVGITTMIREQLKH